MQKLTTSKHSTVTAVIENIKIHINKCYNLLRRRFYAIKTVRNVMGNYNLPD